MSLVLPVIFCLDVMVAFPYERIVAPCFAWLARMAVRYIRIAAVNAMYCVVSVLCIAIVHVWASEMSIHQHTLWYWFSQFVLMYVCAGAGNFLSFFKKSAAIVHDHESSPMIFASIQIDDSEHKYAQLFLIFYRHIFATIFYYYIFGISGLIIYRFLSYVCSDHISERGIQPLVFFAWVNWLPMRVLLFFLLWLGWSREVLAVWMKPRMWGILSDASMIDQLFLYHHFCSREAVLVLDETVSDTLAPQARVYRTLFFRLFFILIGCAVLIHLL